MKRTWTVRVEQGTGHELHNCTSETDFFGPYTQAEAEKLAADLETLLAKQDDDQERRMASAMPLEHLSPRQVLEKFKEEDQFVPHDDDQNDDL